MTTESRVPPPDWGRSLWVAGNPAPSASPSFSGAEDTEIAIVGAGISGLSLAYHLQEAGKDVVMLEAVQRPDGATAASAGVIAPQLVRTSPNGVLRRLGAPQGGRFLMGLAEAGRYLFDLIGREAIDCDAAPHGYLSPVAGREGADGVSALIEEWRPFRQDLSLAGAEETRRLTGCEGYSACLIDPSGGGLDPVGYAQGLAASITSPRVRIFRDSPVISLERRGGAFTLTTETGVLTARTVVLCGNGGNAALHPSLARTVLPLSVVQVATEPLPAAMRQEILPLGHALTDSSADVFSIRFDAEDRLITASASFASLDYGPLNDVINRRLLASIPAYRETPLAFAWKGTAWLNSTLLPRIVRVEDHLFAVQACNGRGLAVNTLVGRELCRYLVSSGEHQMAIPLEKPRSVFGYALARHIPALLMSATTLLKKVHRAPADPVDP